MENPLRINELPFKSVKLASRLNSSERQYNQALRLCFGNGQL